MHVDDADISPIAQVIFLDFDGHVTTNTDWNRQVGKAAMVSSPYDKDDSPGNFSVEELADIVAIW
jgi:hypothetical protein